MGRKLDALLRRNFRTSKFKILVKLAISRIAILKNQHHVRFVQARSDVFELLHLGQQDRALLRVERVIKEQNMVDAFTIMESYLLLLVERVTLIQKNKECPEELKEATSSLMFASSRCGEFPELLHIRGVLSSTFGKEFVARAVELRNNCSVHPKMIQKLSTRQPSLENKSKVLKEIAFEKGISLNLEEKLDVNEKQDESISRKSVNLDDSNHKDTAIDDAREINQDENLSDSIKARKKYRDVAAAAQEAFESAAYAAAAARAAVELSRTESQDLDDSDDENGSSNQRKAFYDSDASETPEFQAQADSEGIEHENEALGFEKIHPVDNYDNYGAESEQEDMEKIEETEHKVWSERAVSASSSDSDIEISDDMKLPLNLPRQDEAVSHELATVMENTDDKEKKEYEKYQSISHDLSSDIILSLSTNEEQNEEIFNEGENKLSPHQSSKMTNNKSLNFVEELHSQHQHRRWVSMRTRREPRI